LRNVFEGVGDGESERLYREVRFRVWVLDRVFVEISVVNVVVACVVVLNDATVFNFIFGVGWIRVGVTVMNGGTKQIPTG
jgi:hypothetical protein